MEEIRWSKLLSRYLWVWVFGNRNNFVWHLKSTHFFFWSEFNLNYLENLECSRPLMIKSNKKADHYPSTWAITEREREREIKIWRLLEYIENRNTVEKEDRQLQQYLNLRYKSTLLLISEFVSLSLLPVTSVSGCRVRYPHNFWVKHLLSTAK